MNDYTPTTDDVREDYAIGRNEGIGAGWYDRHRDEFDRWLADHDAQVRAEAMSDLLPKGAEWLKAEAWDEGLSAGCDRWMDAREFGDAPVNPYRGAE